MEGTLERKIIERVALRNPIEAAVTCRPFSSSGAFRTSEGVMYNCSIEGSYIETTNNYQTGTILIVQLAHSQYIASSIADDVRPRSICLAEVRWTQRQVDENAVRYGIGLKYLN